MVKVCSLVLAGLLALVAVACLTNVASAQGSYRLGTGDKLKVTVFGEEDASGEYEIDAAGTSLCAPAEPDARQGHDRLRGRADLV